MSGRVGTSTHQALPREEEGRDWIFNSLLPGLGAALFQDVCIYRLTQLLMPPRGVKLGLCLCQMLPHLEQGGVESQGLGTAQCGGGEDRNLGLPGRVRWPREVFEQEAPVRQASGSSPGSQMLGPGKLRQDHFPGTQWVGGKC